MSRHISPLRLALKSSSGWFSAEHARAHPAHHSPAGRAHPVGPPARDMAWLPVLETHHEAASSQARYLNYYFSLLPNCPKEVLSSPTFPMRTLRVENWPESPNEAWELGLKSRRDLSPRPRSSLTDTSDGSDGTAWQGGVGGGPETECPGRAPRVPWSWGPRAESPGGQTCPTQ